MYVLCISFAHDKIRFHSSTRHLGGIFLAIDRQKVTYDERNSPARRAEQLLVMNEFNMCRALAFRTVSVTVLSREGTQ